MHYILCYIILYIYYIIYFARVICAIFPILTAKKSGCLKYANFFFGGEVLVWVLF